MENTVQVRVDFIKQAYDEACYEWKMKLIDEFPELELADGFKKGQLIKSENSTLVVLVTQNSIGDEFSGVVVVADENHCVGYVSSTWSATKEEIYNGKDIDVATILGIK